MGININAPVAYFKFGKPDMKLGAKMRPLCCVLLRGFAGYKAKKNRTELSTALKHRRIWLLSSQGVQNWPQIREPISQNEIIPLATPRGSSFLGGHLSIYVGIFGHT